MNWSRFRQLVLALLAGLLLAACIAEGNYRLRLVFPDQASVEAARIVELWVLEAGGVSCLDLIEGKQAPAFFTVLDNQELDFPFAEGSTAPVLRGVPEATLAFFAAARDVSGQEFLRGCKIVDVKGREEYIVLIRLEKICVPDPAGELPNNLIDDDCDGLTDECTRPADCDDDNICTADLCTAEGCQHANLDDFPCNPKDPCLGNGVCRSGQCQAEPKDCSAFDGVCTRGECDPESGTCQAVNLVDGTPCQDGLLCTTGDSCLGGECTGEQLDCDDGDVCTVDSCSEIENGCQHIPVPSPGAEGPPGDATCENGLDDDCDLLTDLEDPNCVECEQDQDCDDSNVCTADSCSDRHCLNEALPDGTTCLDDLFCTVSEACDAGVCRGQTRDCNELSDDCNLGVCVEGLQSCAAQPLADGTGCDDGLYCTVGDTCSSGECTSSSRDCNDNDVCTEDTCNETSEVCDHTLIPDPGAEGPPGSPTCSNGTDDDCDGLTDMEDNNCRSCTWMGNFTTPEELPVLNTVGTSVWDPSLTSDQCLLVYQRWQGDGALSEIYQASRPDASVDFSLPAPLAEVNSDWDDQNPVLSEDGLVLFLCRDEAGTDNIWMATRPDRDSPFSEPVSLDEINMDGDEWPCWVSPDKLRLYFCSQRSGSQNRDIWMVARPSESEPFGTPVNLIDINSPAAENNVCFSGDELEVFVISNRPGGLGDFDIWYGVRPDTESTFVELQNVAALNTDFDDGPLHISSDGTTAYFNYDTCYSGGCGHQSTVWISTRTCE